MNRVSILLVMILAFFVSSCTEDDKEITPIASGNISIGIDINEYLNELKSTTVSSNVDAIYISLKKDGEYYKGYNFMKLNLLNVLGEYITSNIELEVGTYAVTDFVVVDSRDSVIYLTPKTGSELEKHVLTPLPYEFTVTQEETSNLVLQVLDVDFGESAFDFGYAKFSFDVVLSEDDLNLADVTDVDGNVYHCVKIGSQIWMKENLRVTSNPDGSAIPHVASADDWDDLSYMDLGYCFYDNNNVSSYGALYSWAAIMNNTASSATNPSHVQGICPDGWHLPSVSEWEELNDFVANDGFNDVVGQALKDSTSWSALNGVDYYGFSARPGGCRLDGSSSCEFDQKGLNGFWWSCTADGYYRAYPYMLSFYYDDLIEEENNAKFFGYSVRCLKD